MDWNLIWTTFIAAFAGSLATTMISWKIYKKERDDVLIDEEYKRVYELALKNFDAISDCISYTDIFQTRALLVIGSIRNGKKPSFDLKELIESQKLLARQTHIISLNGTLLSNLVQDNHADDTHDLIKSYVKQIIDFSAKATNPKYPVTNDWISGETYRLNELALNILDNIQNIMFDYKERSKESRN